MFFTETKKLQEMEKEMQIVPGFDRSDICDDCKRKILCTNCYSSFRECIEKNCSNIKDLLIVEEIPLQQLFPALLNKYKYIPFANRVKKLLPAITDDNLFYDFYHSYNFARYFEEEYIDDFSDMAFSYLWDYFPELIVLLERNNDDWDKVMSRFSEEEQAVRRFMNNFCAGVMTCAEQ